MITITEALAEVKNIPARIAKKQEAIMRYFHRDVRMLDPLAKDNGIGSEEFIKRERQGIADLENRLIEIRCAIQKANADKYIEIGGKNRTVAYWLNWRREIAEGAGKFLNTMAQSVTHIRTQAQQRGWQATTPGTVTAGAENQIVINVDEVELAKQVEAHQNMLGVLDGRLQLFNATTTINLDGEDLPF